MFMYIIMYMYVGLCIKRKHKSNKNLRAAWR